MNNLTWAVISDVLIMLAKAKFPLNSFFTSTKERKHTLKQDPGLSLKQTGEKENREISIPLIMQRTV